MGGEARRSGKPGPERKELDLSQKGLVMLCDTGRNPAGLHQSNGFLRGWGLDMFSGPQTSFQALPHHGP